MGVQRRAGPGADLQQACLLPTHIHTFPRIAIANTTVSSRPHNSSLLNKQTESPDLHSMTLCLHFQKILSTKSLKGLISRHHIQMTSALLKITCYYKNACACLLTTGCAGPFLRRRSKASRVTRESKLKTISETVWHFFLLNLRYTISNRTSISIYTHPTTSKSSLVPEVRKMCRQCLFLLFPSSLPHWTFQ